MFETGQRYGTIWMANIIINGSVYRTDFEDYDIKEAYEVYIDACGNEKPIPRPARKAIRIAIEHEIERMKNNETEGSV